MKNKHRYLGVVAASLAALSGCSFADRSEQVADPSEVFRSELTEAGVDDDVAECMLRLGRQELEHGPLSAVVADELKVVCQGSIAEQVSPSPASSEINDTFGQSSVGDQLGFGDDAELDQLWEECEEGSGAACDQLFDLSPVGSAYEQFGVSCGERDNILHCDDLDSPDTDDDDPVPEVYREWEKLAKTVDG